MSMLIGSWLDDGRLLGHCIGCGCEVGVLDRGEIRFLLERSLPLLCFDCDGLSSDQIPQELFSNELHYFVKIDGQWFSVNWPNAARGGRERLAYYQSITDELFERLRASLFLSSSTYLNAEGESGGQ